MVHRALAIVERSYRGSVETQFADVLYLARELNRQLGRVDVALRGMAVTFALRNSYRASVTVGSHFLDSLPDASRSVQTLLDDDIAVYADAEDLDALGLTSDRLVPGVRLEDPSRLARRWLDYDGVWFL